jgi:hypothetical protein
MLTRRDLLRCTARAAVGTMAFHSWMRQRDPVFAAETPAIQYDSDGLIVHKGLDGGDTAQREGWYWFGVWIREKVLNDPWPVPRTLTPPQVIGLLEPKGDGIFHRHPKLPPWNNPHDKQFGFSRDQMVPLVAAMGVWGLHEPLRRLWNTLPQDVIGGTKHTFNGEWLTVFGQKTVHTGDVVGPMTINLFRRAWNEDPMAAGDGNGPGGEEELRVNVLVRLRAAQDRDDTGDDLNLTVMLLMALLRFPSDAVREAANLYAKNRPVSYGSFLGAYRKKYGVDLAASPVEVRRRMDEGIDKSGWQTDASRVFGAPRWYHREEAGANPQLAILYEPIIRKFLE